jgi:hypothetical protein
MLNGISMPHHMAKAHVVVYEVPLHVLQLVTAYNTLRYGLQHNSVHGQKNIFHPYITVCLQQ